MGESFRLGGWGMYPTALAGLVLVAAAFRCAHRPDAQRFRIVRHLSVLTGLVACLAFVSGVIRSFTCLDNLDPHDLGRPVIGVGESLCNVGLGLVMLVIAWIATSVAAYRVGANANSEAAELTDPHGP
jgi:hypothetical protein